MKPIALAFASLLVGCAGCAGSTPLPVGAAAPDLAAADQTGKAHRLSEERGHPLVVYFYPKDGTPGCTKEACAFRDSWAKFQKAGVAVFGISADDAKSHEQFAKEQKLPFPILADPSHQWSQAFGVGTMLGMDKRVSFLLDKQGKVAKVYPDVDPAIHADQVLKDAEALK